ncbi:MAG: DUF3293 domain-containing protein [Opitutae bacterium]
MNPAYSDTQFLSSLDPKDIPEHAFIITAYNPMDEKFSERKNQERNAMLEGMIKQVGGLCLSIIGASKDLVHQELSFLTNLHKDQAIKLAKKFNQRAIFEIERDSLTIVYTDKKNSKVELGSFQDRCINT